MILKKSREAFVKNVTDLATGDQNGKQKLIRFIERVIDRRAGAEEAVKGKGEGNDQQMG